MGDEKKGFGELAQRRSKNLNVATQSTEISPEVGVKKIFRTETTQRVIEWVENKEWLEIAELESEGTYMKKGWCQRRG